MAVALLNVTRDKTFWTPGRKAMAGRSLGRRPGRLPGGHVADRADLLKAINLCRECLPKFNKARAGYVTKRNLPIVRGRCDGCSNHTERGHLLVHHTLANLL